MARTNTTVKGNGVTDTLCILNSCIYIENYVTIAGARNIPVLRSVIVKKYYQQF